MKISHAWHGTHVATTGTHYLVMTHTLDSVFAGTVPACWSSQFPHVEAINRWFNAASGPATAHKHLPHFGAINSSCDPFNLPGPPQLVASDDAASDPWFRYHVHFATGSAQVTVTYSSPLTHETFSDDWALLVELAEAEWDNPLAYDEAHSSNIHYCFDASGNLDVYETDTDDAPTCECKPPQCVAASIVAFESATQLPTVFSTHTWRLVPLRRWRRQWRRYYPTTQGDLVECKSFFSQAMIRTEFAPPPLDAMVSGRYPAEYFVFDFGAQCS